jgi:hypothetical protein
LRSALDVLWWADTASNTTSKCIVLPSDKIVIEHLKRFNAMKTTPDFTFRQSDMGAMYTSLSQDDVRRNVGEITTLAWQSVADKLKIPLDEVRCTVAWNPAGSFNGTKWHHRNLSQPQGRCQTLSLKEVILLIDKAVSHNIFVTNNVYYRQKAGLGMGNPASPLLATLCCANVELRKRNVQKPSKNIAQEVIDFAFRYVDDCLSASCVDLPNAEEYNVPLKVNEDLRKTLFLGIDIEKQPGEKFKWGVIRKSVVFGHAVPRFPHATSNHPLHAKVASVTGNLIHIQKRSHSIQRFLDSSRELFEELFNQRGYTRVMLHKATNAFCTTHLATGCGKKRTENALHNLIHHLQNARPISLKGGNRQRWNNDPPECRCGRRHFGRCARCWICDEWGHTQHDCPEQTRTRKHRKNNDPPECRCGRRHFGRCARCWSCGEWGHTQYDCQENHQPNRYRNVKWLLR